MNDATEPPRDDSEDENPTEASPAPPLPEETSAASEQPSEPGGSETEPPPDEGLPEWEPLTPELVEDEAIRGDFMLRWAVILLAVLMGWTVVQETAVLTHIRSGESLAAHGILPTGRDSLSSTAGDIRWVHLSWLFDAAVAGVYALAGEAGLSVFKAIVAALIFVMLARISLPDVSTWWGSVCSALALVACYPSLTATPHIVTLLGMSALLLLLHRRSHSSKSVFAWSILITIVIWNQLDDRAWIGAVTLLAYALGDVWDRKSSSDDAAVQSRSLLPVALASLLAMLIHPFLWETWRSAVTLYQVDYPAQQAYAIRGDADYFRAFPLWSSQAWSINYYNGAALLLWLVATVVIVLNGSRVRMSHLAIFVTTSLIAMAGGTELSVASLVFAVLATLNAQQWYVANFRQTYSVETSELIFSRGGRALTVLALFALGFAMVSGHLTGSDGRRIGTGFDPRLTQMIDSYRNVLEDSYGDRPFSFRPAQGDVLNWIGQHPFVDSRLRLFAEGSPSILDEHQQARTALRLPRDGSPSDRQAWQSVFDKYDINEALPRLSGETPDYVTFYDLLSSPDWALTGLDADTAQFCRTDRQNTDLTQYVDEHRQSDLVATILRTRDEDDAIAILRSTWPQPPSVYARYFYQPPPVASGDLQRARHYLALGSAGRTTDEVIAATYAAVRDVHRGLADNPSDPLAYVLLGQAYSTLWSFERGLMESRGLSYPSALRFSQTVAAFQHAIICDPQDSTSHMRLFGVYTSQQRHDLALHHLKEFQRLTGRLTTLPLLNPDAELEQTRMEEYLLTLQARVDEAYAQRDEDLAAGMDPARLAVSLADAGLPLGAMQVIESDLTLLSGRPSLSLLYAQLLQECGRTRSAYEQFQGLKLLAAQGQLPDWATYAAIAEVVAEELPTALKTLVDDYVSLSTSAATALLFQHPLQVPAPVESAQVESAQWGNPLLAVSQQMQLTLAYFDQLLPRMEANLMYRALIQLELGNNAAAADLLQGLLEKNPISGVRPVAEAYLTLLNEQPDIPPIPDDAQSPATVPDLFADEPASAESTDDATSEPDAAKKVDTPTETDDDLKEDTETENPGQTDSSE